MVKEAKIFMMGFIFAIVLFMAFSSRRAICESTLPSSVSFSGDSNTIYFLDKDNAKVYRYNIQGRLTRLYIVKELGKDLQLK